MLSMGSSFTGLGPLGGQVSLAVQPQLGHAAPVHVEPALGALHALVVEALEQALAVQAHGGQPVGARLEGVRAARAAGQLALQPRGTPRGPAL